MLARTSDTSPLVDGLVFKKKLIRRVFRWIDVLYRLIHPNVSAATLKTPQKILVSNLGNLGDVLIASHAIQRLREAYPQAEIGVLISSRGRSALEVIPHITWVHEFNHLYHARESIGLCKAALQHFLGKRRIVKEIQSHEYDLAIDLQPFFPNAIPLLHAAKIPLRIGYLTAGFGSYLTHPLQWTEFERYLGQQHLQSLKAIGVPICDRYPLTILPAQVSAAPFTLPSNYIVIHMCASRKEKEWKRDSWIKLIKKLKQLKFEVVLAGRGSRDKEESDFVSSKTGCVNFCNKLTLSQYKQLLESARLLITVDSMSVHLGALCQTPTVILFLTPNSPFLWTPANNCCRTVFLYSFASEEQKLEAIFQAVNV